MAIKKRTIATAPRLVQKEFDDFTKRELQVFLKLIVDSLNQTQENVEEISQQASGSQGGSIHPFLLMGA